MFIQEDLDVLPAQRLYVHAAPGKGSCQRKTRRWTRQETEIEGGWDDLSEQKLEELLAQAIEYFADKSEMLRAHIRTFEDAGGA